MNNDVETEQNTEEEDPQVDALTSLSWSFLHRQQAQRSVYPVLLGTSAIFEFSTFASLWARLGGIESPHFVPYATDESPAKEPELAYLSDTLQLRSPEGMVNLPATQIGPHLEAVDQIQRMNTMKGMLPRTAVVNLVAEYDAHVGRLASFVLRTQPEQLRASDRTLKLSELLEFATIEDAQSAIIDKEVETLLRGSHLEQIDWFGRALGLPSLRPKDPLGSAFVEVTQRRHLYVHADGRVSRQYLTQCSSGSPECVTLGDEVVSSPQYIQEAADTLTLVGLLLLQTAWRKLLPSKLEDADQHLNDVILDFIKASQYSCAISLCDYALGLAGKAKGKRSRQMELIFVLNRAQALRWSGDRGACDESLSKVDWSGLDARLLLGKCVLLDEYDEAIRLMRLIGSNNPDLDADDYQRWPIFREWRTREDFRACYHEVFGQPFPMKQSEALSPQQLGQTLMAWFSANVNSGEE